MVKIVVIVEKMIVIMEIRLWDKLDIFYLKISKIISVKNWMFLNTIYHATTQSRHDQCSFCECYNKYNRYLLHFGKSTNIHEQLWFIVVQYFCEVGNKLYLIYHFPKHTRKESKYSILWVHLSEGSVFYSFLYMWGIVIPPQKT